MFDHGEGDMLIGLAFIPLDAQTKELVAPQLVHATPEGTMGVLVVIGEKVLIGLGDVPVFVFAHMVIEAHIFVPQNFSKRFGAIVAGTFAIALGPTTIGKFVFGEFVFDQPETKLILVIVVSDGNIRVCTCGSFFISEAAKGFIPIFDAVAII